MMRSGRNPARRPRIRQGRRRARRHHFLELFAERLEQRVLLTTVVTSAPAANALAAVVDSNVAVTFDQTIDEATASASTLAVHSMQQRRILAGDAAVSVAGPTVTLDPNEDFLAGEFVQATATAGIASDGGTPATPFVWQFRTAVTAGGALFRENLLAFGNQETLDVALGDLDGDGDLDAFAANRDSLNRGAANRVWINENGQFIDSGQSLGNHNSFGVELGDLDGDGDLDAFVANVGEGNRIWFNEGGVFSDGGQSLGAFNSLSVSLGDVDGDGDLDAFVANSLQENMVWLNDGGFFNYNGQALGEASSNDVELGDVDGDGDLDAFVTNIFQPNRVWLNNGGLFTDSGQSLSNNTSRAVSLGDVDGDGDIDAFVVNSYQPDRVWLNNGGVFTDSGQLLGSERGYGVSLGDLDADGDLDAYVSNAMQGNQVWRNDNGTFASTGQSMGVHSSVGMALGDVDGDGDLDALVANFYQNRLWLNQNPTFSVQPSVLPVAEGNTGTRDFNFTVVREFDTRPVSSVDYEVVLSGTNPAQLADFAGGVLPSGTLTFGEGVSSMPVVVSVVGDVVVEPDEEFTVMLSNPQGGGSVLGRDPDGKGIIRNDEGSDLGDLPAPFPTVLAANGPAHIAVGPTLGFLRDIDVDGQPAGGADGDDLAGAFDDEQGVTFPTPILPGQTQATVEVTAGAPGKVDAWIDFNQDNTFNAAGEQILDSVDVTPGANTLTFAVPADALPGITFSRFRISTAGGLAPTGGAIDGEVEDHTLTIANPPGSAVFADGNQSIGQHSSLNVALGDVDGDGDVDAFVVNGYGESNRVWLNQDGTFTDSGQALGNEHSNDVALGDVDGDGDLDAVVVNASSNQVWFNDGGVFSDSGQVLGNTNSLAVELGDFDGDGDVDIMVANETQANRVWNNDNGVFTDSGQILGSHASRGIAVGDLDGDGDLDAFVANYRQPNRVWINEGGSFTDSGQVMGDHHSWEVELGDLDGDGDLDAFVVNLDHENRVWLNNAGEFTDSGQQLGNHFGFDAALGDLDGDGDLDAFVANGDPGSSLSQSSGNRILRNVGGVFTDFGQPLGNHASFGVALGDLDGDGDLDAFSANYYVPILGVPRAPQGNRIWLNVQDESLVSVEATNSVQAEGDSGTTEFTFTVTRTGNITAAGSVAYSILSTGNFQVDAADFGGTLPGGTVNFDPGQSTRVITLNVSGDTEVEANEEFVLVISDPTPSTAQIINATAVGQILNDDPTPLTVFLGTDNRVIVEETGIANLTAELSAPAVAPVTVNLAFSGTAVLDLDFIVNSAQIVIPTGATSGSVTITALDDLIDEETETIIAEISSASGVAIGVAEQTMLIQDDDDPLAMVVTSFEPSNVGFVVQLSNNIDHSVLNMIDTASAGLGESDIVLQGASVGVVPGTVLVNRSLTEVIFIKTGGPLLPDTYTVRLRSAEDGFKSVVDGTLLDGNGDGTGGDDFIETFTVGEPVAGTVTLSVPDFVRGPGQDVNLPADSTNGIPLMITSTQGVRDVDLAVVYRGELASITAAALGPNMPAGATLEFSIPEPGVALIRVSSPTDLPLGTQVLANMTASIPTLEANENYRRKNRMDILSTTVLGSDLTPLPVIEDDGMHINAYFGDVSGNARINASDASLVGRVAALVDGGFANFPLADPMLLGDVSENGRLNAADASRVAQVAALIPVSTIPPIPPGVVVGTIAGPDPKLSIPQTLRAAPGDAIRVPIEIDSLVNLQAPHRLVEADVVVTFDNRILSATSVDAGAFLDAYPDWSLTTNIDNELGRIVVVAFTSSPLAGEFRDVLVDLNFQVKPNAPAGPTPINLVASSGGAYTDLVDEQGGSLPLEGPITNLPTDSVDGLLQIEPVQAAGAAPRMPQPAQRDRVWEPAAPASHAALNPWDARYADLVDQTMAHLSEGTPVPGPVQSQDEETSVFGELDPLELESEL